MLLLPTIPLLVVWSPFCTLCDLSSSESNKVCRTSNKPKDHIVLKEDETPKKPEAAENKKPQLEDGGEKKDVGKEERCKEPEPKIDNHEPRLGPRPRSHNKVLNPPGGKSSIAFY